jgi:hypothetical protein
VSPKGFVERLTSRRKVANQHLDDIYCLVYDLRKGGICSDTADKSNKGQKDTMLDPLHPLGIDYFTFPFLLGGWFCFQKLNGILYR